MCKSSLPYNVLGIASTILPNSAITFPESTPPPTAATSITSASAVAKVVNPSNSPACAPPRFPCQILLSVLADTCSAT